MTRSREMIHRAFTTITVLSGAKHQKRTLHGAFRLIDLKLFI